MATQKEIQLCQEIIGAAIYLNALGKYSVFVDFSGHVKSIEVRIKPAPWVHDVKDIEGWSVGDKHVYLSTGYKLNRGEDMQSVVDYKVEKLEEIKADLLALTDKVDVCPKGSA